VTGKVNIDSVKNIAYDADAADADADDDDDAHKMITLKKGKETFNWIKMYSFYLKQIQKISPSSSPPVLPGNKQPPSYPQAKQQTATTTMV